MTRYAEDWTCKCRLIYIKDDKGIDAKPGQLSKKKKRTPKEIEEQWTELGKSETAPETTDC